MALSSEDIRAIVDAFEASDWTELVLQHGDTRIELSRRDQPLETRQASAPAVAPPPPAREAPPASAVAEAPVREAPQTWPGTGGASASPTVGEQVDGTPLPSPTLGLFWRSPQPGAPPFVEVGQQVGPNDTVCIVEVMKLMNHVKAGVAGTVVAIPVDNGAMVEHGQTLVVIDQG